MGQTNIELLRSKKPKFLVEYKFEVYNFARKKFEVKILRLKLVWKNRKMLGLTILGKSFCVHKFCVKNFRTKNFG